MSIDAVYNAEKAAKRCRKKKGEETATMAKGLAAPKPKTKAREKKAC